MHPVVTVVGDRIIASYGLCLAAAVLVATAMTVRAASRAGIDGGSVVAAAGLATAGGFAGSWLLFVAVEWVRTGSPFPALTGGGFVFLGAPAGAALALAAAARPLRLPLLRLLDLAPPAVAAGHAIGRIGCFLGGCCYGRPWDGPWSVVYADALAPAAHPPVPRHPAPLYESLALLALAFLFALLPPREIGSGRRIALYVLAYGTVRIGTELFRGDAVRGLYLGGSISTSQLLCAGLVLAGAAVLLVRRPRTA
jgi:phosphatidylglycerol:prolipoprotein diacylglycerol transferase